jgi:GR25 family glycosyltransferase involved in LPS biosynthesis
MNWMYPNEPLQEFDRMFPLKFVINMDHRTDRLREVATEFSWTGIDTMRMPGHVYKDERNSPQWNGALGCLFSHLSILRFAHDMKQNVFIFEDDVKFLYDDSKTILNKACKELGGLDWKMLYIGGNLLMPCVQVTEHLAKLSHCQSTVSYGVRWEFIGELLKYFELIDAPIDVIYANKVIPNHNAYITIPMLTIQRDSYSDIEGVDSKYSSYLEDRYWHNLKMLDKK